MESARNQQFGLHTREDGVRITSTDNPNAKLIRKLRDRKFRRASGLFYVEGLRLVGEAIELGAAIEFLIFSPELLVSEFGADLILRAKAGGIPSLEVSANVFRSISLKERPQGIGAVVRQRWQHLDQVHSAPDDLWIVLGEVADPGNLGTILRTSDAVGAKGAILLNHSTDPYDPTAVRASMGAIFSQSLVRANLDEFAAWKGRTGCRVVGASGSAELDYHEAHYPNPLALMMGSERHGLGPAHLKLCDLVVRIPMVGRSDSLNLGVAAAVILYEIFNQRRENIACV